MLCLGGRCKAKVVNSHSTRKGRKSDFHKAEECFLLLAWRNCQSLKISSMNQTQTGSSWFFNADALILKLTQAIGTELAELQRELFGFCLGTEGVAVSYCV